MLKAFINHSQKLNTHFDTMCQQEMLGIDVVINILTLAGQLVPILMTR